VLDCRYCRVNIPFAELYISDCIGGREAVKRERNIIKVRSKKE